MNYVSLYSDFLKKIVPLTKKAIIVCDASNGPTGTIIQEVLKGSPVHPVCLNEVIDPDFKAHGPNPLLPISWVETMRKVIEVGAEFGVIYDADGDRAIFIDDTGKHIHGYVIGKLLMEKENPPFVVDELMHATYRSIGETRLIPSHVGTRYIKEAMRIHKSSVGIEYSGHFYFKDFFYSDGGIITTLNVLRKLEQLGTTLSAYAASLPVHVVRDIQKEFTGNWITFEAEVIALPFLGVRGEVRDGVTFHFGPEWVNIRPSNTEPVLRLTAGSGSKERTEELLSEAHKMFMKKSL